MKTVALGELITLASVPRAGTKAYPILSMTMHDGLVDQSIKFKKRVASEDTSPYKVVRRNQLVVGFPIDEGVLSFQNIYDEAIVSPAYDVWTVKDKAVVDCAYLQKYLKSPQSLSFYRGKLKSTTARRRTLPKDTFLGLQVLLPPLEEQKRIAAILDQADDLRRKRQHALTRLNQLGQAIFYEMFGDPATNPMGWPQVMLSEVCDINPRNNSRLDDADQVSFLPMASVSEDGSIIDEKVRPFGEVKKGFTYFERGDVLLAKITPCFENGKATITDDLTHPVGFGSTEFHVVRPSRYANGDFLFHLLHREAFRSEGELNMTGSAGQKRVPVSFLKQHLFPMPPYDIQIDFSGRVREIADMKLATASSLAFLNKLFTSLQHRAFRGEL